MAKKSFTFTKPASNLEKLKNFQKKKTFGNLDKTYFLLMSVIIILGPQIYIFPFLGL